MFKTVLLFLIVLCTSEAKRNYQIQLHDFESDPNSDPTWVDKGTLRVTKKSRNQFVVSGTCYLFKNLGNEGTLYLKMYNIGLADHEFLIFAKQAKFCDYLQSENIMYPSFVAASNLPPRDQCPLPKGNYTLRDYTIDEEQLPPVVPFGKYASVVSFNLDNKFIFGWRLGFTVTPV